MKYEDIIEKAKKVKAPPGSGERSKVMNDAASTSMIGMLKRVDRRTRFSIRALQIVYVFLVLFAVAYMAAYESLLVRAGIGLIMAAFILVLVIQQLRYKAYNEDYTDAPMVEYLLRAKKRMRVFTARTWLVIPVWLLIDVAICLFIYVGRENFNVSWGALIILLQVALVFVVALDFGHAWLIWRRDHKPAVLEVDRILAEIGEPIED